MLGRPSEAGTWFEVCSLPAEDVNRALVRPVLSAAAAACLRAPLTGEMTNVVSCLITSSPHAHIRVRNTST